MRAIKRSLLMKNLTVNEVSGIKQRGPSPSYYGFLVLGAAICATALGGAMQAQPYAYTEKTQKMGAQDLLRRGATEVYSMNDGEAKKSRFDSVTEVLYVEDDEGEKNLSLYGQGVSVQGNTTSSCPSWATSGANAVKYQASKDTWEEIYDVSEGGPHETNMMRSEVADHAYTGEYNTTRLVHAKWLDDGGKAAQWQALMHDVERVWPEKQYSVWRHEEVLAQTRAAKAGACVEEVFNTTKLVDVEENQGCNEVQSGESKAGVAMLNIWYVCTHDISHCRHDAVVETNFTGHVHGKACTNTRVFHAAHTPQPSQERSWWGDQHSSWHDDTRRYR